MKLTAGARHALPASDFAGPGRSYPVEDRGHAIAAESRASAAAHAGRMSSAEEAHIDARAKRTLARGKPKPAGGLLSGQRVTGIR